MARLAAAEGVYVGDLLPEDAFADWAVAAREEAKATYVEVAKTLGRRAAASGETDRSLRYLMRAIAAEPFYEAAHLALVQALGRAGQRAEARRAYQRYAARMNELDVEPAPFPADDNRS